MSGPFDEKDTGSDSTDKRPAPTIEGTATEVSVEPDSEAAKPEESDTASLEHQPIRSDDSSSGDDQETAGATAEALETQDAAPGHRSAGSQVLAWIAALFTHALAGLAGGIAVLAAVTWGYLPITTPQEGAGLDELKNKIAPLEQAPKSPDNTRALKELESRLVTLEADGAEATGADAAEVKALSAQVAEMQQALKSMAETAKDGGSVADAAAINRQVAEAERRLGSQIQTSVRSQVQSALASRSSSSADDKAVQALKSEVSDLGAKLDALAKTTPSINAVSKLQPEILALQRRLKDIETTLPSLLESVNADKTQARKANLAMAFAGLRDAVDAGRPYATDLATMTTLSTDTADLQVLIPYEGTGIPTVATLTASFGPLHDEAMASPGDAEPDLLGRLFGSAQSLVRVRRIGEQPSGDGPDAVLARAKAMLDAGNIEGTVTELEKLTGSPAAVFAHWMDEAHARLEADAALQQLQKALLVSMPEGNAASPGPSTPAENKETQ